MKGTYIIMNVFPCVLPYDASRAACFTMRSHRRGVKKRGVMCPSSGVKDPYAGAAASASCCAQSFFLTISSSSANIRSYALSATQKIMAVTPSKQWIHFFLSDRWPPTSNILQREEVECKRGVCVCVCQCVYACTHTLRVCTYVCACTCV